MSNSCTINESLKLHAAALEKAAKLVNRRCKISTCSPDFGNVKTSRVLYLKNKVFQYRYVLYMECECGQAKAKIKY